MSNSTVAPHISREISGVIHTFVEEWTEISTKKSWGTGNLTKGGKISTVINSLRTIRTKITPSEGTKECEQTKLFERALADAVVQEVADSIGKPSYGNIGLVDLLEKILYSKGVSNPEGTLSIDVLVEQVSAKLLSVRTKLASWLRACEGLEEDERYLQLQEAEKREMVAVHAAIVEFSLSLFNRLREIDSWKFSGDLVGLVDLGFQVSSEIIHLDKDPMLPADWRVLLIRGALRWLSECGIDFVVTLIQGPSTLILEWRDQLLDFIKQFPDAHNDVDFEFQVSQIIRYGYQRDPTPITLPDFFDAHNW